MGRNLGEHVIPGAKPEYSAGRGIHISKKLSGWKRKRTKSGVFSKIYQRAANVVTD